MEESTEDVQPEEKDDNEAEKDALYNPEDTMVGAITDVDPIPLEEYDERKWTFFDSRHTGEKITEHPFNGYQPGGMVPLPIIHEDLFIWQHGTEDYQHLKVVNPKAGEDLWVLDMDGHFLVDYKMVNDILYAFFGSLDYDAEENTLMTRINPYTGEVMDVVDLGTSISAKLNNFYIRMGLTEYNGKLAYFYDNLIYIFNE